MIFERCLQNGIIFDGIGNFARNEIHESHIGLNLRKILLVLQMLFHQLVLPAKEQGLPILDQWPHLRLQDRVAVVVLDQQAHVLVVALEELLGSLLASRRFAALLALVDGDALLRPPRAE